MCTSRSITACMSRSVRFVPVKLMAPGANPSSSASSTSPGELASMPAPRSRTTSSTSGWWLALTAKRTRASSPAASSVSRRSRTLSAIRSRSYT